MTEAKARALFDEWQATLQLQAWRVKITFVDQAFNDEDGKVIATTYPSEDYDQARIEFTRSDLKNPDVEETIVHELLHVVFRDVEAMRALWHSQLAPSAAVVLDTAFDHALEGMIDRLAWILVAVKRAK